MQDVKEKRIKLVDYEFLTMESVQLRASFMIHSWICFILQMPFWSVKKHKLLLLGKVSEREPGSLEGWGSWSSAVICLCCYLLKWTLTLPVLSPLSSFQVDCSCISLIPGTHSHKFWSPLKHSGNILSFQSEVRETQLSGSTLWR